MDNTSFTHIIPALRLFSGPDSLHQLYRELERIKSRRAVVMCGASMARSAELQLITTAMAERCAGVFSGVRAHSPVPVVEAAAQELQRLDADAVIAVGGGSAIVTARAASILMAEGRDAKTLCTTRDENGRLHSPKLVAPKLPQLIVPTTPTTAMVKAGSAVFDPVNIERLALFDPKTRAQAIFIHPQVILSAPRELIVSASLNTLVMSIEGLIARSGDPIADGLLMHALRLLAQHLPAAAQTDDAAARSELMIAAVMCGQGSDYSGAGITTVLGHTIGARHELDNGIANAIMLAHVLRFNAGFADAGMQKVATALGLPTLQGEALVSAVINTVQKLFASLGVPPRLRDAGIPQAALPGFASAAMGDWFLSANPRAVTDASDLQQVLEAAW
jgi:alcohol dehydrogenase class IV